MAFNSYMHERNIYKKQPDFTQIALDFPAFRQYAMPDAKGTKVHVDFSNPDALRMVTEILLKKDFNLDVTIPQGFLIPTVPQRLNYILWLEDLLNNIPKSDVIRGIDIGTGPCAIFSILGAKKNNWNFTATESSEDAIQWAKKNILKNNLEGSIKIVKVSPGTTLSEILSVNDEKYDFCLCNPPFFGDIEEIRKKHHNSNETIADVAQKNEIFFQGGELNFVKNILSDSLIYKDRVCLFTSMCGKKKSFLQIVKEIKEVKGAKVTTTEFCQGNTIRWGIAWTFNDSIQFEDAKKKIKPKKTKPPLEYQIPLKDSKDFNLHNLLGQTKDFLKSLQIAVIITKSSQYFAELLMKSNENTWTHQRRKRREMERHKKDSAVIKPNAVFNNKIPLIQVTTADCDEISEQNNCVTDNNLSHRDNSITEYTHSCNSSENLELSKKRKDFSQDNSSVSKKFRSGTDEKNKLCSEACLNVPMESSDDLKAVRYLKINDLFTKVESNVTQTSIKNDEISVSYTTHSEDNIEKLDCESNIKLEKGIPFKQDTSSLQINCKKELSVSKNETTSEDDDSKCNKIDEVCHEYNPNFVNHNKVASSSQISEDHNQITLSSAGDSSGYVKIKADSKEKIDIFNSEQGSILHCCLHLIKGKGKIYVKMNCPPTADRNSMYQVFQLIKNKIK